MEKIDKLEKYMKELANNYESITFEDISEGKKYTIRKDIKNNKYILETKEIIELDSSNELSSLFDSFKKEYKEISEKDYFPSESEYPDKQLLWQIKSNNDENTKISGSTHYPAKWGELIKDFERIKNK